MYVVVLRNGPLLGRQGGVRHVRGLENQGQRGGGEGGGGGKGGKGRRERRGKGGREKRRGFLNQQRIFWSLGISPPQASLARRRRRWE